MVGKFIYNAIAIFVSLSVPVAAAFADSNYRMNGMVLPAADYENATVKSELSEITISRGSLRYAASTAPAALLYGTDRIAASTDPAALLYGTDRIAASTDPAALLYGTDWLN